MVAGARVDAASNLFTFAASQREQRRAAEQDEPAGFWNWGDGDVVDQSEQQGASIRIGGSRGVRVAVSEEDVAAAERDGGEVDGGNQSPVDRPGGEIACNVDHDIVPFHPGGTDQSGACLLREQRELSRGGGVEAE